MITKRSHSLIAYNGNMRDNTNRKVWSLYTPDPAPISRSSDEYATSLEMTRNEASRAWRTAPRALRR